VEGDPVVWPAGDREELFGEGGGDRGEEHVFQYLELRFGEQVAGRFGAVSHIFFTLCFPLWERRTKVH
jgi:hypothetical protein